MVRSVGALTLALSVLLVVSSCSGGRRAGDELLLGGTTGIQCDPIASTTDVMFAFDSVESEADVELESVTLIEPQGLSLIEAYLAPIRHQTLLGVNEGWPPSGRRAQQTLAGAQPLAGSTLTPGAEPVQIVLHLRKTSATASFAAYRVNYLSRGDERFARTHVRLELQKSCSDHRTTRPAS